MCQSERGFQAEGREVTRWERSVLAECFPAVQRVKGPDSTARASGPPGRCVPRGKMGHLTNSREASTFWRLRPTLQSEISTQPPDLVLVRLPISFSCGDKVY